MPFLDASALETDPSGMAWLRAVIQPPEEPTLAQPSILGSGLGRMDEGPSSEATQPSPPLPTPASASS
jgi:hypothetical protein